jgi:hypothetical protein
LNFPVRIVGRASLHKLAVAVFAVEIREAGTQVLFRRKGAARNCSRSPTIRLEGNLETSACGGGETFESLRRRLHPSALQPRNNRLTRIHAPSELLLGQAGINPRADHGAGQLELRLKRLMRFPVSWALHPLSVKIAHFDHVSTPLARRKANSISRFSK